MIADDSNMRGRYETLAMSLENDFMKNNNTDILNITQSDNGIAKVIRWFDSDFIVAFRNMSYLRISLRFMHGRPYELLRINFGQV